MRNYNWIADLLFGMGLALFFILVTSDVFAEPTPILIEVGDTRITGSYDSKKGTLTLVKKQVLQDVIEFNNSPMANILFKKEKSHLENRDE